MKQIIDFLRKIGLLQISSGDYQSGEFDNRSDLKKKVAKKEEESSKGNVAKATVLATVLKVSSKWMILFWILVAFVVFFLLIVWVSWGIGFWLLVFAVFWFLYFKHLKIQILSGKLLIWKMAIVFVVLFLFSLVFLVPSSEEAGSSLKKTGDKKTTKVEESGLMEVNQAQFSSFVFGSDSSGGSKPDTVNLTINPILTFKVDGNSDSKLESLEIRNLGFTKKPAIGKVKIIHPKHRKTDESCTGFYYGGCEDKTQPKDVKSGSGDIEYEIVEGDVSKTKADYYDQVFDTWFVRPEFRVVLHEIGEFNYEKVMKKYKVVSGGEYPKYAGIEAGDVASVLEFDVVAKLSNGEKFKKHFVTKFNGEDLLKGKTVQMEY